MSYAQELDATAPLRAGVLDALIRALALPRGSRGVDVGCGLGTQALELARAVGPGGSVSGVDLSQEHVDRARERVAASEVSERISLRQGDASALPFDDAAFDWAWSMDLVGVLPGEAMLREMIRVVRPKGLVAITAWTHETLLPGHPVLESRLRLTRAGLAPSSPGQPPQEHFLRSLGRLRGAGLRRCASLTLAGSVHAPLSEAERAGLVALLAMRWPGAEAELAEEDRADFARLCTPASEDFVLDEPDYTAFFTYTLFHGRV